MLQEILDAFNRHDLDATTDFFAKDAAFEMSRGPEPWGIRFAGKENVRKELATRFSGIPDVHYGEDSHWIAGNRAVSEWTLTGTTSSGKKLRVRGCDLWEFRDGLVLRKDSFSKIVDP